MQSHILSNECLISKLVKRLSKIIQDCLRLIQAYSFKRFFSTALPEFHVIVATDDLDKWLVKSNKEHNLSEEKL